LCDASDVFGGVLAVGVGCDYAYAVGKKAEHVIEASLERCSLTHVALVAEDRDLGKFSAALEDTAKGILAAIVNNDDESARRAAC
jgi:hypothetical protein